MRRWLGRAGAPSPAWAGYVVLALAAILSAGAPLAGDLVRGQAAGAPEGVTTTIALGDAGAARLSVVALLVIVAAGLAARIRRAWTDLLGLTAAVVLVANDAFTVVDARGSDALAADASPTVLLAGQLLLLGAVLAAAGLVTVIVALQRIAPAPWAEAPADGVPGDPAGRVALLLSIGGVLVPVLAAAGIAVGAGALADARATDPPGRTGLPLAAVVLGTIVLALWFSLAIQAALTAVPTA